VREPLLDVKEVSGLLSVHPKTIYAWTASGKIPSFTLNGRIRFDKKQIDEFLERHRVRFVDPEYLLHRANLPLDAYDRLHLKGGLSALSKKSGRCNYGFGSVYIRKTKKGRDRWCIDYPCRGERIREVVRDAQTRGEALTALQAKVADSFNGRFAPQRTAQHSRFTDFADRFIDEYAKSEKTSWKTDVYRLRRVREFFGELKMSAVTEAKVREFREARLRAGRSRLTANREIALLKKMFSWGISRGLLATNPAKEVKMFSEFDTARDRVLRPDEEVRLFAELPARTRPVVLTVLHTGLRYREALGLTWDNVDLARRRIKVEKTKSKRARFIPINSALLNLLEKLRACSKGPRVFPFKSVRTGFENACTRAGLADFTFHDLRRTFGTRLLERGADIVTIQKLYGHSSVLVTQRYLHPNDGLSIEAVELLAGDAGRERQSSARICHAEEAPGFPVPAKSDYSVS
jgi:excisionase family DNA binding protein